MGTGEEMRTSGGSLGRVVVARLAPGVELLEGLGAIVEREGLRYALILGGVASLRAARLRNVETFPHEWPIEDEHRVFLDLEGPLEMLSISGSVSRRPNGQAHIHAHVVVSTGGPKPASCYGGHLVPGATVFSTAEIALAEVVGLEINRAMDPETKTLEIYPQPPAAGGLGRR